MDREMEEKELIKKIECLKAVKADQEWANWLKVNILSCQPKEILSPKPRLAIFVFQKKYKKALAVSLASFFFIFSFVLAGESLPGSFLYPLKTFAQNTRVFLSSGDNKPLVKMEIAREKLEDLSKVNNNGEEVKKIAQEVKKDLSSLTEDLTKGVKEGKDKRIVLNISKEIRDKNENLQKIIQNSNLKPEIKDELSKTIEETQSQVVALIIDTTDEINNCPTYLKDKLSDIEKYFTNSNQILSQWNPEEIMEARNLLGEATNFIKSGNCLEAMEKIESLNKILSIHSLENQVENSNAPENKD